MIVFFVTSEPVPAVVGIATRYGTGMSMLTCMNSLIFLPSGCVDMNMMAFAVSIGLPPPSATRKSQPSSRYTFRPASTILSIGSEFAPAKVTYGIFALASAFSTFAALPNFTMN